MKRMRRIMAEIRYQFTGPSAETIAWYRAQPDPQDY